MRARVYWGKRTVWFWHFAGPAIDLLNAVVQDIHHEPVLSECKPTISRDRTTLDGTPYAFKVHPSNWSVLVSPNDERSIRQGLDLRAHEHPGYSPQPRTRAQRRASHTGSPDDRCAVPDRCTCQNSFSGLRCALGDSTPPRRSFQGNPDGRPCVWAAQSGKTALKRRGTLTSRAWAVVVYKKAAVCSS